MSQGNVQGLPNGNYFVGWGDRAPYFSEFDSGGHLVYDAEFVYQSIIQKYAIKSDYVFRPDRRP